MPRCGGGKRRRNNELGRRFHPERCPFLLIPRRPESAPVGGDLCYNGENIEGVRNAPQLSPGKGFLA